MNVHEAWVISKSGNRVIARRVRFHPNFGEPVEVKIMETIRRGKNEPEKLALANARLAIKQREPDAVMVKHWKNFDPSVIEMWI